MRAARITSPGIAQVVEIEVPKLEQDEVLIEVAAAGICGTDMHIYRGEYEAKYPITPGHEFSGTVVEIGAGVQRFHKGDRVTVDPNIPCNRCYACQHNQPNQCEDLKAIGVTRDGAFAQFVSAPESNVFSIGSISFPEAAMLEPLACVVWGLKRIQVQPGDQGLIFGAGPMGCLILQALKSSGASEVVITDINPYRLEIAAGLGAHEVVLGDEAQGETLKRIAPKGYDIVAEATGIPDVLTRSFDFVRARGTVWVFGVCPPEAKATFIPYDVFRKDLSVVGSFAVNRTFHESIALIQSGAVDVKPLISHRLPLEAFTQGIEIAESAPDRMKVQFCEFSQKM
jgi:2-desacetyl-2-hydroxyethyl bacteriochlorophyllide A dehydrogenase